MDDAPATRPAVSTEPQGSAPHIEAELEDVDTEDVPELSLVRRELALPRLVARSPC
jgi:hypothetical protein